MKMFRILRKSIRDSFKSIFRNFSLSMASISCTAITLVLVAIAILVTYNVNSIAKDIKDVLTIIVFVDTNATQEQLNDVESKILDIKNVDDESLVFNSKESIREEYLERDDELSEIIGILSENENPIQSTFIVKVKDAAKITNTAKSINRIDGVTHVKYGESVVNKVLSGLDFASKSCVIAVAALIVVTAFLIANTIKITIFSRRQEINIMRLVGTSNTVINLPFLIEGFVLGIIGALLPVLITIFGYSFLYDYTGGKLLTDLIRLVRPSEIIYSCSFVLLLVGGLVGMFGSLRAVRRYLKI